MEKKKIGAKIIADSVNNAGDRVTTFMLTFPRFILPELNTHRQTTKNSASSRAIPFKKMVEMVGNDPFIPIAFQREHSGMQGTEYFEDFEDIESLTKEWLFARDEALNAAISINSRGCTKQLTNRLLEPFMWHNVLLTATELDNFFELRCPKYTFHDNNEEFVFYSKEDAIKYFGCSEPVEYINNIKSISILSDLDWLKLSTSGAEIHIQALAESMWDELNNSEPKLLEPGEWHIPFGDRIDKNELHDFGIEECDNQYDIDNLKIAVSTARCARLSYMTFDNKIDYKKDLQLHDQLLESKHFSPFEHCCKAPTAKEISSLGNGFTHVDKNGKVWSGNFKGFIQYRSII